MMTLITGNLAAALFTLGLLYGARRRLRARPFRTAKRWLDVHIYGSLAAMLIVIVHAGFSLPHGVMGWALLLLSLWTTISGVAGRWLQRELPRRLATNTTYEAIYERIPNLASALTAEADALMQGASHALMKTYQDDVRPMLLKPAPVWGWVSKGGVLRTQAQATVTAARGYAAPADKDRVTDLEAIVADKSDLDEQFALQHVMRSWLLLHVPPAFLLFGFMVIHVIAVVWY